jgi:hypothetical protein
MKLFKKAIKEVQELDTTITQVYTPKPKPEEEWIWVDGYKGTDKNMQCQGYQYEPGVTHTIPNDQKVEMCKNGFHLCLNLNDVFYYYPIGHNSRFFKVKALVRKSDVEMYGHANYSTGTKYNKLVAKSIIFISELTIDEIFEYTEMRNWPTKYKQIALEFHTTCAEENYQIDTLIADGYSKPFACHIVKNTGSFDIAHAIGSQPDLSMDMKVLTILYTR